MNGISRYVLRQTLAMTALVTVAFAVAVWLVQSLRLIDLIVNRGLSVRLFLELALLILPRLVEVVLPIAVFVAVLFVFNKLTAESEIVVMRAAGVSQAGLATPAIAAGALTMAALLVLSLVIVPASNRAFRDLQFQIRNRIVTVLVQDGVFNTISERLMIYDMGRNEAGDLLSLVIYDGRDPSRPVIVFAERGAFVDTPEGPRLVMVNGTRQQRDLANGHLSVLQFEKYTLDLAEFSEEGGVRDRDPDERSTAELLFPTQRPSDEGAIRALSLEINMRLAGPISGLSMALLPILCLLPGEFNRRGQSRRVTLAIALAFLFEFVDLGLRDVAGRMNGAMLVLYLNLMLPLAATAWFLWRDTHPPTAAPAATRQAV